MTRRTQAGQSWTAAEWSSESRTALELRERSSHAAWRVELRLI